MQEPTLTDVMNEIQELKSLLYEKRKLWYKEDVEDVIDRHFEKGEEFMTTRDVKDALDQIVPEELFSEKKIGVVLRRTFERIGRKGRYGYLIKKKD